MYGFLLSVSPVWTILGALVAAVAIAYLGSRAWAWIAAGAVLLVGLAAPTWLLGLFAVPSALFLFAPTRRALFTSPVLSTFRALGFLPEISATEREAIEAGTVWVDGELFSGKPNFERVLGEAYPDLTPEERAFLDGPVEEVCRMTNDWEVHRQRDLPAEVWSYIKEQGFFGMIIPKECGGLGFSASANSAVLSKLSSRSMTLGITVMLPNSLGPAELLHHYGTQEQKDHYLPRLARGEEVPCFALTEPGAGSDAGSMTSSGDVFRGDDGELYVRLTWRKRYITMAAISTLLGLAFKLRDPENLLGKGEELGITCALVPSDTPGVRLGRRHDPLGVPFYNCPTEGDDVVVPIDAIIGGVEGVGRGWPMLMECLAAGRGISLPASSTAGVQRAARVAGAYAAVRKQFGLPIGKFEGIAEPLARIGGAAYTLEAARRYTCGGLDSGAKPSVVTAMAKYNFTETLRDCVNDAMDVLGGAAISVGPRNQLANAYFGVPISITVEGANILTRTLMVFGQGAIRCHPYAYAEISAAGDGDVAAFDRAFWKHVGHVFTNGSRALVLGLTRGRLAGSPVSGPAAPYVRKLSWASSSFAFLADVAMATLGGDLKRKEALTGRFSDVFSWMYLASATIRRFEAEGRRREHEAFFHWSMQNAFARIQQGFDGIFANYDVPGVRWLLAPLGFAFRVNRIGSAPSDRLGGELARALQTPGAVRDALTPTVFRPASEDDPHQLLERAFELCHAADGVAAKIKQAVREQCLPRKRPAALVDEAVDAGVITSEEAALVREAEAARAAAIEVDEFELDEYMRGAVRDDAGDAPPVARAS